MKKTEKKAKEKTNPIILETVLSLNKTKARVWKDVAKRITKPTRQTRRIPLHRINRYTKEGDVIVVPGKILGNGGIDHKITVAALSYSQTAIEKLNKAGCKTLTIKELSEKNPKGNGVKIIG